MGAERCGKDGLRGRVSRLEQDGRGASAAARIDLGSCHLGNCTIGKLPLGKIPLGSCHLGKILWESTYHTCVWNTVVLGVGIREYLELEYRITLSFNSGVFGAGEQEYN